MPPKGWRKNPDGTYPPPNHDHEKISIDEILFPKATLLRLSKSVLQDGNLISRDSVTAIQRSATVFVSHLMLFARNITSENGRSTVNTQDLCEALEKVGYGSFVPTIQKDLEVFIENKKQKKMRKLQEKE
ncbi:DNA polymerase epsilon noncatalytic subunit, partial [Ascoidea rubescens DSM 1968]